MIYLDAAATTPLDPEVREAMLPYLGDRFGNASSIHGIGRQARAAIDDARDAVGILIGADYSEIYFTSGGTEADNLALVGAMLAAPPGRDALVTSVIEHHAVLHTAQFLTSLGKTAALAGVSEEGLVVPATIGGLVSERTALVSVMAANNEIGTVQPIAEVAALAHEQGALFHTDAVQSAGLLHTDVSALGCDLLTLSAHKLYGPKGAGALYVRRGVKLSPILHGGAQERERRAGTENVAAIVGFGAAARLAAARRDADALRLTALRDRLIERLLRNAPGARLNGHPTVRLANNVNISVPGVDGAALVMGLDLRGVAASSGSACSSGSIEPSHVLAAIGMPRELAASGLRLTLCRTTTEAEVDQAAGICGEMVWRALQAQARVTPSLVP